MSAAGNRGVARATASTASAGLLVVEVIGSILIWTLIPLGWMRIGGGAYSLTESLAVYAAVAFFGFIATLVLTIFALGRVDRAWIRLRRRAGHDQQEGALTEVVATSVAIALLLFICWYYLLTDAYVLPFMPAQ